MMKQWLLRTGMAVTAAVLMTGCATSQNPDDPLEGFNRTMFTVNDKADQYVLQPVAKGYKAATPQFVRTGVSNFFNNLNDLWSAVNQLLQGRGEVGLTSLGRFFVNTTLGLGGIVDWGSALQMPHEKSDLGQTLGSWGVGSGPYLVLPLYGSTTIRDAVALPGDFYGDPWTQVYPVHTRNTGTGIKYINKRAELLDASDFLQDSGLDKYTFIRDMYVQQRRAQIERAKGNTVSKEDEGEWK